MLVTFAGMVIEVKLVARENAPYPMLVNSEPGAKVIEAKLDA